MISNLYPPRYGTSSTQSRLIRTSLWMHALLSKPKKSLRQLKITKHGMQTISQRRWCWITAHMLLLALMPELL